MFHIDGHVVDSPTEQELLLEYSLQAEPHLAHELNRVVLLVGRVLNADRERPREQHLTPGQDIQARRCLGIVGIDDDTDLVVVAESVFEGGHQRIDENLWNQRDVVYL